MHNNILFCHPSNLRVNVGEHLSRNILAHGVQIEQIKWSPSEPFIAMRSSDETQGGRTFHLFNPFDTDLLSQVNPFETDLLTMKQVNLRRLHIRDSLWSFEWSKQGNSIYFCCESGLYLHDLDQSENKLKLLYETISFESSSSSNNYSSPVSICESKTSPNMGFVGCRNGSLSIFDKRSRIFSLLFFLHFLLS